jgi:hypothetical protein
MMKSVFVSRINPKTKDEGLRQFSAQGYTLIDATYTPVDGLADPEPDRIIMKDMPILIEALRKYVEPNTDREVMDMLFIRGPAHR